MSKELLEIKYTKNSGDNHNRGEENRYDRGSRRRIYLRKP